MSTFDITRSKRDAAGLWNMLKPPNREPTGNLCMKWCEGTSWQLFFLADRIKKEQFGRINLTRSPRSKGMTHVGGVHSHGGTPLPLDGCLQWKIRNKNWMIGGYPYFRKLPFLGNVGLITKIQELWEITIFGIYSFPLRREWRSMQGGWRSVKFLMDLHCRAVSSYTSWHWLSIWDFWLVENQYYLYTMIIYDTLLLVIYGCVFNDSQ